MKATYNNSILKAEDEYTSYYNWSERTAFFFQTKKQQYQFHILDSIIDLMCMAATTVAMVNCM